MNERDLFAAANAIADPAERLALLERECAHRPELRRRIERLINIPLPPMVAEASPGVGLAVKRPPPSAETKSPPVTARSIAPADDPRPADSTSLHPRLVEFLIVNRRAVAVGTLVAVTFIGATIWSLSALIEAERQSALVEAKSAADRVIEEHRAREASQAESRAKAEEERRRANLLRDQVLFALQEASSNVPSLVADRRNIPAGVRAYVETLARRWEAFASGLPNDNESRRLQADARIRAAELWRLIGRGAEAVAGFEAACRLFTELSESSPTDLRRLAYAHNSLASILAKQGRINEAFAESKTAVNLWRRLASESSDPTNAGELAQALSDFGRLLAESLKSTEALEAFREAIDLQSRLLAQFPDRPDFAEALARLHDGRAIVLHRAGRTEEAINAYRTSVGLRNQTSERHPNALEYRESLASAHANLALLLDESNKRDAALMESRQAVGIRQAIAERQPERRELRLRLVDARAQLAGLLLRYDRPEESLREFTATLAVARLQAAQDPEDRAAQDRVSRADASVGAVLRELNRAQEAVVHYRSARDVRISLSKRFPEDQSYARRLADVHQDLFELYRRLGDAESAVVEYQSGRATFARLLPQFPEDDGLLKAFIDAQASYGEFLIDQGKPSLSVEEFSRAIDRLDHMASHDPKQAPANDQLRHCLWGRARAYAALQNGPRALRDADRVILLSPSTERQEVRALRPGLRITAGDASGAVADVEELARDDGWTASQWYGFACDYAAASSHLPSQAQELSRRAIVHLYRAMKSGFKDAAHARRDPDLDPLRSRADFQKWLEDLESAPAKPLVQ